MILKQTYRIITVVIFSSHTLFCNLTTLQHWDPSPIYSASNNLMPANNQIVQIRKARTKGVQPDQFFHLAINLSGFVQSANRARSCNGCGDYGGACDDYGDLGTQMGDFRGTIYALGLLLGDSPNGNNIWINGINDGNIENISPDSINATQLPPCLKDVAKMLSGNLELNSFPPPNFFDTPAINGSSTTVPDMALMYNPQETTDVVPSLFNEGYLGSDTTFFGAFSLPLKYKKYGFRFELGAEFGDHVGLTIQTGISNIKQTTTGLISISSCAPILPGCNQIGTNTTGATVINPGTLYPTQATAAQNYLYGALNFRSDDATPTASVPSLPNTQAQTLFNEQISENAQNIFGPCGINQSLCDFDEYSIEDVRFILTIKNSYGLDRYTQYSALDDDWFEMIFTPYVWLGGSFPVAKKKDYSKLLSLPFGNNGHASVGGAIGMTFDFKEGLEVGFEGGVTHFLPRTEYRPVPNNELQRVVYPFCTNVNVQPGDNWHFKALLNSYQFINHISFWATYEIIEHKQDCYKVCDNPVVYRTDPNTHKTFEEKVFTTKPMICCSDWRAQFLNLSLIFDIQPGMQMSFLWQQSLTPRNAYYPVSVMGSFTFLF